MHRALTVNLGNFEQNLLVVVFFEGKMKGFLRSFSDLSKNVDSIPFTVSFKCVNLILMKTANSFYGNAIR